MKIKWISVLLIFREFNAYSQDINKVNIAVIDLDNRGGFSKTEIGILTDRLRSMLVGYSTFDVVDRRLMEEILNEQGFQLSGCTSKDCAVEAGKILGVEQMVSGSIGLFGTLYIIDISLIDVETSRIVKSITRDYRGEMEGLIEVIKSVAEELANIKRNALENIGGSLDIKTNPSDANVYIDDVFKGKSPNLVNGIMPGEHVLKIKKPGYKIIEGKFTIENNQTKEYDMNLIKQFKLNISSNPSNATVFINNKEIGNTPIEYVTEEDNILSVKILKSNYKDFIKNLSLSRDQNLEIDLIPESNISRTVITKDEFNVDNKVNVTNLSIEAITSFKLNYNSFGIEGALKFGQFSKNLPLHLRLGFSYASLSDPGEAWEARQIFINNNTSGDPVTSGKCWYLNLDMLYQISLFSLKQSYIFFGPRYSSFTGTFEFAGGNEMFDVVSSQWGAGTGLIAYFSITRKIKLNTSFGFSYYFTSELSGHDTSYSPDGNHVNPRSDYDYSDADNAINQPKFEFQLSLGLAFILF